jgi:hypothetical protein
MAKMKYYGRQGPVGTLERSAPDPATSIVATTASRNAGCRIRVDQFTTRAGDMQTRAVKTIRERPITIVRRWPLQQSIRGKPVKWSGVQERCG